MTKKSEKKTWSLKHPNDWGGEWQRFGKNMVRISKKEEEFKEDGKITLTFVPGRK